MMPTDRESGIKEAPTKPSYFPATAVLLGYWLWRASIARWSAGLEQVRADQGADR